MFKKYWRISILCCMGIFFCLFSRVSAEEQSGLSILLSKDAIYTIRSYGECCAGRIAPETNIWVTEAGFIQNYFVQETDAGDNLIDDRLDWGHSIHTWFWSEEEKKVEVTFDLGRKSKIENITAITIANNAGGLVDNLTLYLSDNPGRGWKEIKKVENDSVFLDKDKRPETYSFEIKEINETGRYVKMLFYSSRSPFMAIAEIKIYGVPLEENTLKGKRGLVKINERPDPDSLVKLPEISQESLLLTNNKGKEKGTGLPVSYKLTSKHEGKDDNSAAESDPENNKLIDGNYGTAVVVTYEDKPYIDKEATIIFDLKDTFKIERVIVWSAGHYDKKKGSFINAYSIATSLTGEPGTWSVAQSKVVNPFWPGEAPSPANSLLVSQEIEYPIVSPPLDKTARFIRLDLYQDGHSGLRMEIGEVEIWGSKVAK